MDTLKTLFSRKSVRSYTGEKVSEKDLQTILKAAYASPVGMGKYENVHLTVIEDQAFLKEIEESAAKMFNRPGISLFNGAPVYIAVSAKPDGDSLGNLEYSNAAIIVHNMTLAAVELGLGSCYIWGGSMALSANPGLTAKLGLPEGFVPCCGIVIGATTEQYSQRDIPDNRIATDYMK